MKLKILLTALICVWGANNFLLAESLTNSTLSAVSTKVSQKKNTKEKKAENATDIPGREEAKKLLHATDNLEQDSDAPLVVNGDKIEYSKDTNLVIIEGRVVVVEGESVLTCDKATVNTATNDAHAEGNVILKDKNGTIKAKSCDYNFKTKTGEAFDATLAYPPYYGQGKIIKKVSENEIQVKNGYFTTCDKDDHPHYRMQSRLLEMFPGDKVTARATTFRAANTPIIYLPKFTQNLKDDRMHVQVTPGKSKDWGLFILTSWRYDLLQNSGGRINLDYREKQDLAWGIDNYYDTKTYGKGYFKTYYMNQRNLGRKRLYYNFLNGVPPGNTTYKERYRIQWRHKWEMDKNTYWLAEYHKITDTKLIKDYFLREYEKDSQPVSYIFYNHILPDSSHLTVLNQKRTNRIFTETEKLPEIKYDKPTTRILNTPLYFSNNSTYVSFNKKFSTVPLPTEDDDSNQKLDNYTRLSLPFKLAFLELNPYAGNRETYYRRIAGREVGIFREIWDSGINLTTRFYRIFNLDADIWGMEFNKLRHIISPNIGYSYVHPPSANSSKLIDIDSIGEANQIDLSLENKLQTKRRNKTVDFLRFIASTNYFFNTEGTVRHWNPNLNFDLEAQPYAWLRYESDAIFNQHRGFFSAANFDLKASGKVVSLGGGYRYEKESSSQMTGEILFNLIKGWSFKIYQRLQFKGSSLLKEQDYVVSKELHCWVLDIKYNVLREKGETIWIALRLKAFPEMAIDYGQNYHEPKPNSQGYFGGKSSD